MARKQTSKSPKNPAPVLTPDEEGELQLILDRLQVQNPEGESYSKWLESMKRSLEGRENLVVALLQALSRNPSDVGFRAFESFEQLVQESRFKKLLKQAVYRFSQRGYGLRAAEEPSERVVLVQAESRLSLAHMAIGPESYLMLSALVTHPQSSHLFSVSAYFDTSFSRLNVKVTATSHKQYREFMLNVGGLFAFPFCEIPLWHAAGLLKEMTQLADLKYQGSDLREADQLLRPFRQPEREPYVYEIMEPVEQPETELQGVNVEPLFTYLPLSFIIPPREKLAPLAQRVREVDQSVLVIPREMQIERVYASTARAIEELIVGGSRQTLQRLIEEMALWLKLSREDDSARAAWVVAQHVRRSSSLGENPFLQQLMFIALREYWPEDFKTRDEAAQAAKPYRETDSGLVLLR